MRWNATLYDKKHDFISEYGKGILSYFPENKDEMILDLACVTGILTSMRYACMIEQLF